MRSIKARFKKSDVLPPKDQPAAVVPCLALFWNQLKEQTRGAPEWTDGWMAARYFLGGTMKQICFCATASFESQDWSKNDEKLLQAVEYNDAERVASLLLRKGLAPTKLDSEGKSAFHLAAMRGNVGCLEVMLAHGADAMTADSSGHAALHLAAKHGHPQCVSKLLQASCPVDLADGSGRTALHHAAVSGCISCLEILCDFKAPLNTKDQDGVTPLMLAVKMGHSELCRYLLHRGAAVNARDQHGRTALMVACENGSVETVEVLIHGGARVGLIDAKGHDAAHYGAVTGDALIQHYLQEAARRCSWASEEESTELSSQASSPRQSLSKAGKNVSPRKRKAPPPPAHSTPNQHAPHPPDNITPSADRHNRVVPSKPARGHAAPADMEQREAYEELVRLRQERAQFLLQIRSLEQQQEKHRQELEFGDGSLHMMEKQVEDLQKQLADRVNEKENLGKELEMLRSRLSSVENEKENTSYDIETLQDEEGDLLEFPGTELLLSKRSLSISTEELLATLQGQVQSLAQKNKELLEKIQVLENYEKDESNADASGDFVPVLLYDSLRSEFDRLKEQHAEAQAALKALEGTGTDEASSKLVPAEAYEQLKAGYERQIQALRDALKKSSSQTAVVNTGLGMEESHKLDRTAEAERLARELTETQELYQAALAEVKLLQDQMELDILSVEEAEAVESSRTELETVKAALRQAEEDLQERDQEVKDLVGQLEARQGCPAEEILREKEALLLRCSSAEAEVRELRGTLMERACEAEDAPEGHSEAPGLQEEAHELQKQLDATARRLEDLQSQVEELQGENKKLEAELQGAKESLASKQAQEAKLKASFSEAEQRLLELKEKHRSSQQELAELQGKAESYKQESVTLAEHIRVKEGLEGSIWELRAKAKLLEQELGAKAQEASLLQAELDRTQQDTVSKEAHEQLRATLAAEADALNGKLSDLSRKHERTCTEVFQVQREALFMKSEKHAAEAQLAEAEKQLKSLRAESERIQELHSHIADSAKLVKEKDRKITELSKEVFKLKESLSDLSELSSHTSVALPKASCPQKAESKQEVASLRGQIKELEQKMLEAERRHNSVVSLYRGHLLYAIQGHMDEDIQRILSQILKMQRLQEQGR